MFTVTTLVWLGYCYSVGVATVTALAWLGYCYLQRWYGYCYSTCVDTVTTLVWLLLQRWRGYCHSVGMVTVSMLQNWRGYCHSVGVVTVTALVWLGYCYSVQTSSEYGVFIHRHLDMKKHASQTIYQRVLFHHKIGPFAMQTSAGKSNTRSA